MRPPFPPHRQAAAGAIAEGVRVQTPPALFVQKENIGECSPNPSGSGTLEAIRRQPGIDNPPPIAYD